MALLSINIYMYVYMYVTRVSMLRYFWYASSQHQSTFKICFKYIFFRVMVYRRVWNVRCHVCDCCWLACGRCLALFWCARRPASWLYELWQTVHLYGFSPKEIKVTLVLYIVLHHKLLSSIYRLFCVGNDKMNYIFNECNKIITW